MIEARRGGMWQGYYSPVVAWGFAPLKLLAYWFDDLKTARRAMDHLSHRAPNHSLRIVPFHDEIHLSN